MAVDPDLVGRNGKSYEEAFTSFCNEVLDVLDVKRGDEQFKRQLLSKVVLWHPTGFFGVRYRTGGAARSRPGAKLYRDHVYTRRFLADQIFSGADLKEIFVMAGTLCYVTPKEHQRLSLFSDSHGWDRYQAANIQEIEEIGGDR